MKVVFLGPSAGAGEPRPTGGIVFRPPARMGDIAAAVLDGANVVGLVDGTFVDHAAVWHKEILFALSEGVRVFGAASMGALRAAECAAFGMIGVGRIFEALAAGEIVDDADVAVVHAPHELGYRPLSAALIDAEATFADLAERGLVSQDEARRLSFAARSLFFADRTHRRIASEAIAGGERRQAIARLLDAHRRDIKGVDARLLVERVRSLPDARSTDRPDWPFRETLAWRRLLDSVRRRRADEAHAG